MTTLLNKQSLAAKNNLLPALKYNVDQCGVGIVHIGIGAFHRGHQAVFTDQMLAIKPDNWRISAVSLRSPLIRDQMVKQDYLYTVVERDQNSEKISVIGAIDHVLVAPENPSAVIAELSHINTRVVTITVTEKGYCRDNSGQHLDFNNPAVRHDLDNLEAPQTLVGFLVAAALKRQAENLPPLTIISCDNLSHNGDITRTIVHEFAAKISAECLSWIEQNYFFCNSMVDRIVPAITEQDINYIKEKFGVIDQSVIVTEPFKQWIIQDNFAQEKPPWDSAGALFVEDVSVYEQMKLRLLNGTHSALAYAGFLLGYEYIHQAIADKQLNKLAIALQQELINTLDDVPGVDLADYAVTIKERFANHHVRYKTSQVACDGSQKLPQRLLMPIQVLLKANKPINYAPLVIAIWLRYLEGVDEQNVAYSINDPYANELSLLTAKTNSATQIVSKVADVIGMNDDLKQNQIFISKVASYLNSIREQGLRNVLEELLGDD